MNASVPSILLKHFLINNLKFFYPQGVLVRCAAQPSQTDHDMPFSKFCNQEKITKKLQK